MTYFGKGIARTQFKRDQKAKLLASIESGDSQPLHGLTKQEAIIILRQDISDFDEILARMRSHEDANRCKQIPLRRVEAIVSAENWHEERDRLVQLLQGIETGEITHIDNGDRRELQAASPQSIAKLKARLAQLNARLGDSKPGNVLRIK